MASTRSTIQIIIEGITRGLNGAAAEAEAATRRVEAAENNVNQARARSEDSAARLQIAEGRLEQARAAQGAAAQRIADQETRINEARARSEQAAARLGQSENELDAIRRRGGSTQEIAAAEERINRARRESEAAAGSLQTAERHLDDLRRQQGASALGVAQAEDALRRARRDSESSSGDLARAEEELARRRRELDDANRRGSPLRSFFAGIAEGINPIRALGTLIGDVTTRLGGFGEALSGVGGPIVQAVVGLVQFAAVLSLIGGIVGIVGGVLGQALAGIPALLFALGAGALTVVLGLDGIKKAAEVLQPAFDKLQASVSAVFVRQLTPAFRDLAAALPKLTDGFRFVAVALSGIAQQVIGFVTSARGIEVINGILRGTATLFSSMAPGIRTFVQGLLEAANVGKTAFQALGTALGSVFAQIGDVFARLSADGTIGRAVQGLAATITGLGAVVGPIIELFIRMGAALGASLGTALTDLGAGIQNVIPFFEHLAQVAGTVLVDAFNQLGPPLRELVNSILPGASSGMDGFASLMHNVVLPAVAGFINWLRTDGIPGLVAFTQGAIVQFGLFANAVLSTVSVVLGVLHDLFFALALIPGPFQQGFAQAAAATEAFKTKVDELKTTLNSITSKVIAFTVQVPSDRTTGEQGALGVAAAMDRVQSKSVTVEARTVGEVGILGVAAAIDAARDKTVTVTSNVVGLPENLELAGAIGAVLDKTTVTTSTALGAQENLALSGAIGTVLDKTTTTTSNVIGKAENDLLKQSIDSVYTKVENTTSNVHGTQENRDLRAAIDNVISKTVEVVANVFGIGAVQDLVGWIGRVVGKTVDIVTNIITNFITGGRASGGPVSAGKTYLVGERGPELITLGSQGGFVSTAAQTRAILDSGGAAATRAGTAATGSPSFEVRVFIGDQELKDLVRTEISVRDRATRRTVLAGSGTTF